MDDTGHYKTGNLQLDANDYQKCFVGYSVDTPWSDDFVQACNETLPAFGMQAEYATNEFDPTATLRQKVVNLIAGTRYGIYDLSYWRRHEQGDWIMPRNVLIELGIAIALNRPTLLLRHANNRIMKAPVPSCLESISPYILEFSGYPTLKKVLTEHIPQWKTATTTPKNDLYNRYCTFGQKVCDHREEHPHMQQWRQKTLRCHISDGNDPNRTDFRHGIEEVLRLFDNIQISYLDGLPLKEGYRFLLCSCCQAVRTTPFAIYRITPCTPAETFIAIGLSLALEILYEHPIPKILLTPDLQYIPSLLSGYEVVIESSDQQRLTSLRKSMPRVIQRARKTVWKSRPLPFVEIIPPRSIEPLNATSASEAKEKPPTADKTSGSKDRPPRKKISASQVTETLKQAQVLQERGRFDDAIDLCELILESGFDRPDVHYFLGWLYQEQRRWDEAIHQYQLLLDDPDYALSSYYALGQCYRAKGDLRTAAAHFEEAVDRVNLDALTIDEVDQLVQLCQEASETHLMLGEQEQAFIVYNALLGFLRSRGWSNEVAKVELMLQKAQNASASSQPAPPQTSTSNPLSPEQKTAKSPAVDKFEELPDWLKGILNEADQTPVVPKTATMQPNVQKLAHLVVRSTLKSFPLTGEVMSVGRRDPTVGVYPDINLADMTVGRRHACIRKQNGYFTIEDLGALNKTSLNGIPLTPYKEHPLKDGDILRFGSVEVIFREYATEMVPFHGLD